MIITIQKPIVDLSGGTKALLFNKNNLALEDLPETPREIAKLFIAKGAKLQRIDLDENDNLDAIYTGPISDKNKINIIKLEIAKKFDLIVELPLWGITKSHQIWEFHKVNPEVGT